MKSFRKMLTDSRSSCRVCLQATRPAQRSRSASTTNRKTIRSCQRPITGCSHMRHWMRWWRIQRILTTMRCRRRQTSRCFEKSSKTGNHTLNCWHHIVKIPENLRHSQSSRDISGHLTRPLPLPIRLQSGLISKEKCTSHFHAAWCRSVLESRKVLMSERKSSPATVGIWYMWHFRMPSKHRKHRQIPQGFSDLIQGLTTFWPRWQTSRQLRLSLTDTG